MCPFCSFLHFVSWVMFLFQAEKQSLEQNLQKTEEDLSRQLTYAQQVSLLCTLPSKLATLSCCITVHDV